MKKIYSFLLLFALSFIQPGCKPLYYELTGVSIGIVKETVSEYGHGTYYGPANEFDTRIAFVIEKEYEYLGRKNKCAQSLGSFSLIDKCYATTLAKVECSGLDPDTFGLYFLTSITCGEIELNAEDNLLHVLKEKLTIEENYLSFGPITIYSDETLLGEMTFAEDEFTAVFKCRTKGGSEFEARTTVKIKAAE